MTWPRDHKYVRSFQGSPAQTDVTKMTCKVSINGGAATTYSSTTTPAITQAANCAFLFSLAFPALTFNDGDVGEFAWLYNNVQQGGGVEVFGLAELDGAHYTPARGDKLDELDSILTDVLALLTRLPSDVLDELVTGHNTANSVGKLLQNLDAAISTRLATSGYTAPDNTDIATILTDVTTLLGRLPADVWDELLANHTIAGSAGKALGAIGVDPWTASIPGSYSGSEAGEILAAIKLKTDLLGSGAVRLYSPTALEGKLELFAGDDYLAADGRAITWPWTTPALASVRLKIGTVTFNGTSGGGFVSFDLTSAQTAALPPAAEFEVIGTLPSGSKLTIVLGACSVKS